MEYRIKRLAIDAARVGGEVLKKYFGKKSVISTKKGIGNIVTRADQEAEEIITSTIKRTFPEHAVLGEEGTKLKGKSSYLWSVDPLDGTLPYAQGLPWFSVCVGVLKENQPYIGVVYLPFGLFGEEEVYFAMKGKGAFLNERRIAVNKKENLREAFIGFDFAYTQREKRIREVLLKVAPKSRYTVTLGWASGPLCFLALGLYDGYLHQNLEHWDIAAASLIVEEAGGRVTDLKGQTLEWEVGKKFDYLASNGKLHKSIISLLRISS